MEIHGKVSVMDLIHKQNLLLKCMLPVVLLNKGKGMDPKETMKITRLFDKVVKITDKRFMEDMKKYNSELAVEMTKKSLKY